MKLFDDDMLGQLVAQAAESPRQRSHHNVHESLSDVVQKLFVAATKQSYFRPHRHPAKSEFALVLRGRFAVFTFDDQGNITDCQLIGEGTSINGLELPPNTWHGWLSLSDDGVFFETKQGPYDPATAAEFAPWAPAENTPEATDYLDMLRHAITESR
jgi:cupin fold WbuC family metalloprotein